MRSLFAALGLGLLLVAVPVHAASPSAVAAVAGQLHAPSCPPNFSVADCPTDEARQMQSRIASLLDQGLSPDQVVDAFVRDYGPQVRFVPPTRGGGLLAWLLPGVAVLAGAAVCLRYVRRSREPEPGDAEGLEEDPVIAARLRDYL